MRSGRIFLLTLFLLSCGGASSTLAEWDIICEFWPIKGERVSLFTIPDGSGDRLSNAFHWNGVPGNPPDRIDATITLTLYYFDEPVVNFPREDMLLETTLGGLQICNGGSIADADTDENGQTTFSQAIYGSGATDPEAGERCRVYVLPGGVCPQEGFDLQFNSPDMDADFQVNLTDVVIFSQVYGGDYDYAADFYWDGVMNLSDVVLMVQGWGAACP